MEQIEVWIHQRTNAYFLVGREGALVFGPLADDEILHQYRVASNVGDSKKPGFYECFTTFENPYASAEFAPCDVAKLSPSVTEELVPVDVHVWVDFFAQVDEQKVAEAKRLAETAGANEGLLLPAVGRVILPFRSHPIGSIVLCPRIFAGETMTVVEWA